MVSAVLQDTALQQRRRFISDVAGIVGSANIRAFYLPSPTEGLAVADAFVRGVTWTHANTPTGRLRTLGSGVALSFNGTSDYLTTPDAAAFSFGDGSTDSPFSCVAVASVVDTAAGRALISKSDASNIEWNFVVASTDSLQQFVMDNSTVSTPFRSSDSAISQGSWRVFGQSYAAGAGANPENAITLYQDGAVIASTGSTSAGYTAMENLTSLVMIGGQAPSLPTAFFNGLMGCVLLVAGALSTAQHAALTAVFRRYFRI